MAVSEESFISQDAGNGHPLGAFEKRLLRHRSFLRLLAYAEIVPSLRKKIEPSDIVQQTLLEAHETRDKFQGESDPEMAQWLRRILQHNIIDSVRALQSQKRDISREQPLVNAREFDQTSLRLDRLLATYSSPSQKAIHSEQLLQLSEAIFQLPEDQREAIIQHHLKGRKLAQISADWGRSQPSIAGLLQRGLRKLRTLMNEA